MGNEIVYCHKCGDRLLQSDFEKGRAVVILKRSYCGKCSEALKTGTSKVPVGPAVQPAARQTRRIPVARQPERRLKVSRSQLIALLAILAFILLVLIVFVVSKTGR